MKRKDIPFSQTLIRGQIGKKIVIKHYKYGVVKTKYPDMTRIVPSDSQRRCREKFRAAYAWAKLMLADPEQRATWEQKAKRKKITARSMLIRAYMRDSCAKAPVPDIVNETAGEMMSTKISCMRISRSRGTSNFPLQHPGFTEPSFFSSRISRVHAVEERIRIPSALSLKDRTPPPRARGV